MSELLLEQDGPVATVTLNRPEARNAMTFEMYDALHDACDRLDRDAAVRVVILTGAGDRAFASGTDIRQFLAFETREDALGYEARIGRVLSRIAGMRKPTLAMLRATRSAAACSWRSRATSGSRRCTPAWARRSRVRSATSSRPRAWRSSSRPSGRCGRES